MERIIKFHLLSVTNCVLQKIFKFINGDKKDQTLFTNKNKLFKKLKLT